MLVVTFMGRRSSRNVWWRTASSIFWAIRRACCELVSGNRTQNSSPPERASTSDRKSTRLNSSHVEISYAVFCLKKKKKKKTTVLNIKKKKKKNKKKN